MPDRHKEIARELTRLVAEGKVIYVCAEILARPEKDRKDIAKKIKGLESALKSSGVKKGKGASSKAAEACADAGLSVLKMVEEKDFSGPYQRWYSEALRVIEQLLPDRYDEFRFLYRLDKAPKNLDVTTYTISDYIHGTLVPRENIDALSARSVAMTKIKSQTDILSSAQVRLDSLLADIEGTLEATLLDDELETATGLLKAKHLRSAGIVAGVVLERHLKTVLANHQIKLGRKKPQIASLNDALKEAKVFDLPRWREVQRLGDIRNLCGHDGEREPKSDEVQELIAGTERIIATVF